MGGLDSCGREGRDSADAALSERACVRLTCAARSPRAGAGAGAGAGEGLRSGLLRAP
jgi:hypothetical protein